MALKLKIFNNSEAERLLKEMMEQKAEVAVPPSVTFVSVANGLN